MDAFRFQVIISSTCWVCLHLTGQGHFASFLRVSMFLSPNQSPSPGFHRTREGGWGNGLLEFQAPDQHHLTSSPRWYQERGAIRTLEISLNNRVLGTRQLWPQPPPAGSCRGCGAQPLSSHRSSQGPRLLLSTTQG